MSECPATQTISTTELKDLRKELDSLRTLILPQIHLLKRASKLCLELLCHIAHVDVPHIDGLLKDEQPVEPPGESRGARTKEEVSDEESPRLIRGSKHFLKERLEQMDTSRKRAGILRQHSERN